MSKTVSAVAVRTCFPSTAFLRKVQHESLRKGQVAREISKPSAANIPFHSLTWLN